MFCCCRCSTAVATVAAVVVVVDKSKLRQEHLPERICDSRGKVLE